VAGGGWRSCCCHLSAATRLRWREAQLAAIARLVMWKIDRLVPPSEVHGVFLGVRWYVGRYVGRYVVGNSTQETLHVMFML
jgi:hypothetical protein